jgi:hypothetical protein
MDKGRIGIETQRKSSVDSDQFDKPKGIKMRLRFCVLIDRSPKLWSEAAPLQHPRAHARCPPTVNHVSIEGGGAPRIDCGSLRFDPYFAAFDRLVD